MNVPPQTFDAIADACMMVCLVTAGYDEPARRAEVECAFRLKKPIVVLLEDGQNVPPWMPDTARVVKFRRGSLLGAALEIGRLKAELCP